MKNEILDKSLAEIVNGNFRASKVFDKYGLDFCCKGKRTLMEACNEKSLPIPVLVNELVASLSAAENDETFSSMTNAELIQHIVETHHTYVRQHAPLISNFLIKVSTKHGDRYPYMRQVFIMFSQLYAELIHHMHEEEDKLFPLIRKLEKDGAFDNAGVSEMIPKLEEEHNVAGSLLAQIRTATNNFEVPDQACNTFRVVLHLLEDFESDLHRHVFKENHVLFQRLTA